MSPSRSLRLVAIGLGLACALVIAFALRAEPGRADPRSRGSRYVGLDDAESAYRLRLVELALATGAAPTHDGMLDAAGSDVPWPPLVHGTLAFAAAHVLPRDPRRHLELGGYDEADLLELAAWIGPLLGTLAALAAALAGTVLVERGRHGEAAVAAALLYAALPICVARETAGSLHAHPWVAALGFAELAALAVAVRAKERVDVTVGALVCGLFAGLGLLAGPESWPISASVLGTLAVSALRLARERKRDAWRATMLFVASGLAVVSLGRSDQAMRGWLPSFELGGAGLLASSPATIALVLVPLLAATGIVFRDRVDPSRAALLGAAFVATTCSLFDRRFFAPLAVCLTALVVAAAGGSWIRASARRARSAAVACGIGVAIAIFAWARGGRGDEERHDETVRVLRRFREISSSPGGFNHPDARQSWRVASAPALAGSILFHSRRGVLASAFDGHASPSLPLLRKVFAARDLAALDVALAQADCEYLVLTPRMLLDPALGPTAPNAEAPGSDAPNGGGVLASLALSRAKRGERLGPLELVAATELRETREGARPGPDDESGPAISIWARRRSDPDAGSRETIRPDRR